ncbi:hypothetical protein HPB48_008416 [Haemaphysalis longicornis]|uniref:Uncharacterized protein n=1 Tax=Haemaphysalis longicornis TaxID=44386 RepID=A0A9J6H0S8_HAELO|nr:hypothetical protein HPB48_008416 [Haemaphysalis longicornis]
MFLSSDLNKACCLFLKTTISAFEALDCKLKLLKYTCCDRWFGLLVELLSRHAALQGLVMPQMQLPMGVPPPPNHMLMVPPNSSQTLLGPSALGLLPPHLGLPGAALGLPLHPPMSIPVTSQAPVMPVVTMAGSAATSAGQPAPTVPAPAAEGQGTDVVPMAIDGDATPTDEDGTSEASRMGLVPPPRYQRSECGQPQGIRQ